MFNNLRLYLACIFQIITCDLFLTRIIVKLSIIPWIIDSATIAAQQSSLGRDKGFLGPLLTWYNVSSKACNMSINRWAISSIDRAVFWRRVRPLMIDKSALSDNLLEEISRKKIG